MEEKITNENAITVKRKYGKHKKEIEKSTAAHSKDKVPEGGKTNTVELQNSKQNIIANKEQGTDKGESVKGEKNRVLKRKLTEDGVIIERVLSEGEASSGFETVSSIDSKVEFEDEFEELDLSSSDTEHDYNVIVRIENELAYLQNRNSDGRRCYWEDKSDSKIRNNSQSERFLGKYPNPRNGIFRSYNRSKHWRRDNECAHERYDGTDRWSREDDDSRHSRRRASCDREWSRCSDHSIRSREGRCGDQSKISWRSISNDGINRSSKKTETIYMGISRDNRERNYRFKTSSYKEAKADSKSSRSFEKSNIKRNLPNTRQTSFSKSPSASIWERLDSEGPRDLKRLKKEAADRSRRPIKKERTPFLVELERKLKEAENQKTVKKADVAEKEQNKTPPDVSDAAPVPEAVGSQATLTPNLELTPSYTSPPSNPGMYTTQYPSIPTLSVENLPLVPGPTGLPVHITATGEQIPHDMDGRRIPVSLNGYYLPLDPTGRLFAHIVSPGNQAVPIHITEDGILRLPNSEPVPYGPSHNLPVDIDGNVILIGPDSRPLGPCPNLPRQPPLHLLNMTQSNAVSDWQKDVQEGTSTMPQTCQTEDTQTPEIIVVEELHSNPSNSQLQSAESYLLNFVQNSCGKANKEDLLINYQKRARQRKEDLLKCKEIEKNLGVSPSKGGVKRSIPRKLTQKKTLKDDFYCDYDPVLDSSDSDSASLSKPSAGTKKGRFRLSHEVVPNSEETQNVLSPICDNEKRPETNPEDFVVVKIKQALKSLSERNFKPPMLGRFIMSEVLLDLVMETSPNASPLLRNRVKLPFITPNSNSRHLKDESPPATAGKTAIIFSFLAQEKSDKREKAGKSGKTYNKNFNSTKFPVFTFDFAVQCDFTSMVIQNLNMKISEMEMEVVRLRNVNANLLDGFRNVHEANEKKSEELGKALLEIEKRNNEILALKRLINEKGK